MIWSDLHMHTPVALHEFVREPWSSQSQSVDCGISQIVTYRIGEGIKEYLKLKRTVEISPYN